MTILNLKNQKINYLTIILKLITMKCFCTNFYTKNNKPRILISCGHTYCQKCLQNSIQEENLSKIIRCPKDKQFIKFSSIQQIPLNLSLFKMIKQDKDECENHKKYKEVFCLNEYEYVCESCVLFGDHKGHDVIHRTKLKQLQNQVKSKIDNLNGIIEQSSQHKEIVNKLNKFKIDLINKIKQKYIELNNVIMEQQQKNIEKLQIVFQKILLENSQQKLCQKERNAWKDCCSGLLTMKPQQLLKQVKRNKIIQYGEYIKDKLHNNTEEIKKYIENLQSKIQLTTEKSQFIKINFQNYQSGILMQKTNDNLKNTLSKKNYSSYNTLICNSQKQIPIKISPNFKYIEINNMKLSTKKGLEIMQKVYKSNIQLVDFSNNLLQDDFFEFKFNESLNKIILKNNKFTEKAKQKTKLYQCNGIQIII